MPDAFVLLPENQAVYETVSRVLRVSRRANASLAQPLTICGPAGCGKTALLRKLGQSSKPSSAWLLQSGVDWADDYRRADRDGATAEWQQKQAKLTTLILDGIDAVARKGNVSEQLCAVIDDVIGRGGVVILTMSSMPGRRPGFSPRLADRIRGGTTLALGALSHESSAKLLQRFANARQMPAERAALQRLAAVVPGNPGELQRVIAELEKLTIRRGSGITTAVAGEYLRRTHGEKLTLPQITKAVAKEFSAKVSDLRAPGRSQSVVVPRQTAMFLAREIAGEQYQAIGDYFGRRNHSTVLHSVRKVEQMLDDSPEYASRVLQIREELGLPA